MQKIYFRMRPAWLPLFWRKATCGPGIQDYVQKRDWVLVLDAADIPFKSCSFRGQEHLYVPPLLENRARREIAEFIRENKANSSPGVSFPVHKNCYLAALFILPLIIWHCFQAGILPPPSFLPNPALWQDLGDLDGIKIGIYGQWRRVFTALTLHVDSAHLWGNVFFGGFFLSFLARLTGAGRAFLFAILAGAAGNMLSVILHSADYRSVGFSTAVFAAVGLLAGIVFWRLRGRQKIITPVACACALLALLGSEGQRTDYLAHLCGLFCGIVAGILEGLAILRRWPQIPQFAAGFLGLALLAGAWLCAFAM